MTIRPEFLVERQGRQFVLYAGLLDLAHSQGLRAIRTTLLQVPSDDNGQTAIVRAEVETDRGTFSGIGDANPNNVNRAMLTCTIRLAETRAKARALRDAVNVGVAACEELDGTDSADLAPSSLRAAVPKPIPAAAIPAEGQRIAPPTGQSTASRPSTPVPVPGAEPPATPAQLGKIRTLMTTLNYTDHDVERALGVDVAHLSKRQASQVIDMLESHLHPGRAG